MTGRDIDFIALNVNFTMDVMKASTIVNLFPVFLRPVAAKFLTSTAGSTRRAVKHLGPIIQERLDMEEQYGPDWPGKPNDLLTWLIEDANQRPERKTIENLSRRILAVNFVSIHTISIACTFALYALAEHPELVPSLREEVETAIDAEGWTKSAMGNMKQLDSFIKEVGRRTGVGAFAMTRKVMKDFTFSDGTTIPAGNTVSVAGSAMHFDEVS
ncbi:cytochrome P450 [Mycena floridula]|nr:cytochrome P450 [Mycena floridula]